MDCALRDIQEYPDYLDNPEGDEYNDESNDSRSDFVFPAFGLFRITHGSEKVETTPEDIDEQDDAGDREKKGHGVINNICQTVKLLRCARLVKRSVHRHVANFKLLC